ncbi:PqqD family protein [Streptomyces olivoreticuli]|uniref:PqqD family protein n=1 Tax=Streptomyces olivoreticuli TaxID=68246 RepID=UPI0013C356FB|nr:PqqD family protein [Streptomyces olivoreticuli]
MRYRIASDVVWIPDDGEVRLYDAGSGEFQALNTTAAEVWLLISEGCPADDIAGEMARRYAGTATERQTQINLDVRKFLESLLKQGLVLADEGTA